MIAGTIAGLTILFGLGIPRLKNHRDTRTWVVYFVLCALVIIFTIRYVIGAEVYGPLELLMHIFGDVLHITLRRL